MAEALPLQDEIELSVYLEKLLRRRWIIVSVWAIVFLSVGLYTFTARPKYQATALLIIEKERGGGSQTSSNGVLVESSNLDYYETQYRLLKSDSLLQKVYDSLHLENAEDFRGPAGLDRLRNAVTIMPISRSRLVNVKATALSPRLSADIANTLAQQFVEENLGNQLFISKEILQALQIKGDSVESRRVHESLPAVVNNQLIQGLKAEYAKLQSQTAEMSKRYTEKHPVMTSLKSNMASLQGQIETETDRVVQSLKTELSGQFKGNNVRVVDEAKIPRGPFTPNKPRNMILAAVLGFVLGIVLALLVETLDQSIRTQEDVEIKLSQPFLGAIPFLQQQPSSKKPYDALVSSESSLTSESFRNMRTMVDFAGISGDAKQFLVTSSVQEEGKTYISTNLAVAFAQLGQTVLLIDGDLRRPKLHRNFGISSERGLTDFLVSGKSVEEVDGLLQEVGITNLKVLVCGTRPPNPSELLNTPKVGALVSWAKAHFDRVIIDCTPMFPIHDTLLWGRHFPAALFVVRYGGTRAGLVRLACQRLDNASIKLLGIAINAARPSGLTYAAYGYHYYQYYQDYAPDKAGANTA